MKVKLQLKVVVEYDIDSDNDDPHAVVGDLSERLHHIAMDAYNNGLFTDDLGAYVEDFTAEVVKLETQL